MNKETDKEELESPQMNTRGLSPLEKQVAELAVAIQTLGEQLPANLARKFIKEVQSAASKSSRYYIDISGRKNYLLDDVTAFIKDFPVNTLFTYSDIHRKIRHNSASINATLRKLSNSDLDLDLCSIDRYYIKPGDKKTDLNLQYIPGSQKRWSLDLHLQTGKDLEAIKEQAGLLALDKEFNKKAAELLRLESQRYRKKEWWKHAENPRELEIKLELAPYLAAEIAKNTFKRIQTALANKGYVNAQEIKTMSYYTGPSILIARGNKRSIYEATLRDENIPKSIYGDGNKISFSNLEEECFYNSNLVTPLEANGKPEIYYRYDPALLRKARKRQIEMKLASRK